MKLKLNSYVLLINKEKKMKKLVVEFLGTFFLMLAASLSGNPLHVGLMLASFVYIGGHISGGHFNPAVTLAVSIRQGFNLFTFASYALAQTLGAALGAVVHYWLTTRIFFPHLEPSATLHAFFIEAALTFVLCMVVLTMATAEKLRGNFEYGLAIGFALTAIIAAGGPISGGVFNPAIGVGSLLFSASRQYFAWTNVLLYGAAPLLGGLVAAVIFVYLNDNIKKLF